MLLIENYYNNTHFHDDLKTNYFLYQVSRLVYVLAGPIVATLLFIE